jgi:site-specific DNA-methyltransferase (adenine-specific)
MHSQSTESIVTVTDCIQGMRKMEDSSVDVVVTSPPYNIGKDYATYLDRLEQAAYLDWCVKWASEVSRVLKEDGSFFLNLGSSPRNPTVPHELLFRLLQTGGGGQNGPFVLQNTIHWIKSITVTDKSGATTSRGHFKPINSKRYITDCHEYVFHLTKKGQTPIDRLAVGVEYQDKSNIARWGHTKGKDRRCRGNTWFIPYETITSRKKDRDHPATFPVQLPEWCIRLHGEPQSRTVMDPFLGLGSTWLAALRCKVERFYGFDIDPYYVKLASESAKHCDP